MNMLMCFCLMATEINLREFGTLILDDSDDEDESDNDDDVASNVSYSETSIRVIKY